MRDAGGALGAEASLTGAHPEPHLASHVVQLPLGQGVHDLLEHASGGHLALADDLLVGGTLVA